MHPNDPVTITFVDTNNGTNSLVFTGNGYDALNNGINTTTVYIVTTATIRGYFQVVVPETAT